MITRAQMRRQLRAQGGIMNAVPRQGYFLGKLVRKATKAVKKVAGTGCQREVFGLILIMILIG